MSFEKTTRNHTLRAIGIAAAAIVALGIGVPTMALANSAPSTTPTANSAVKPTIVLVHGAWADASSFAPITKELQDNGYTVRNAPNQLRGLASDAAYLAAYVNQSVTGPVVLVGHSYGGSVITNAALSIPNVKALVYVDAYAPAEGESVLDLTAAQPGSVLGVADPSTVFDFVQYPGAPTGDVDAYIKPALFPKFFAARLPGVQARELASSQSPVTLSALSAKSGAPAWASIKSFFFIGTDDKILPPAEQRAMAQRANGVVVEGTADHLSLLETPRVITDLIVRAAH